MEAPAPSLPESTCRNCGSDGALQVKGEVVVKQEVDGDFRRDGPLYDTIVSVARCRFCEQPTVWTYVWGRDTYEQFAEQRLYPRHRDDSSVPPRVRARLDEALQVKRINPDLYAVAMGRVLETICSEEGVAGKDLASKLRALADARTIPGPLSDIADELRRLRNLGAHDAEVAVAPDDVPLIDGLAESLLEYLYRGPAHLAAIRQALDDRRSELIRDANERRAERRERWTRDEMLYEIEKRRGPSEAEVARRLFRWVDERGDMVESYGAGKRDGSFQAGYDDKSRYLFPFALYTYGRIEIHFQYLQRHPSFAEEAPRRELLGRLNTLPGVDIDESMLSKRPSIALQLLTDEAAFRRFVSTLEWAFARAAETVR